MKKMLSKKYNPLDCDEVLSYTKQDYYWLRSSYLNYFEEPYKRCLPSSPTNDASSIS